MIDPNRFTCDACEYRGRIEEMLSAPNPFDPTDDLYGCPKCKSINCFTSVCDEANCWRSVSWGQPTKDGYRQTCHEHGVIVEKENQ